MTISIPILKSVQISERTLRRTLMVLLAFIMTHLIAYQKLPFTAEYSFPWIPFSIFVIYGLFICEINSWNYRRLSPKMNGSIGRWRNTLKLVSVNLISCAIIFTILSVVQMLVFEYTMNPFRFIGLMSVCLMISAIETAVFIINGFDRKHLTLNKIASSAQAPDHLTIVRNQQMTKIPTEEIAHVRNQSGVIMLIKMDGQKSSTHFETLTEVEEKLEDFFRANRQTLISRQSVKAVKSDVNGKLKLELSDGSNEITISRYKSRAFKNWLEA